MDIARMPVFGLGHSLGAKLHVIRHCSGGAADSEALALMAFNNFGITDNLALARQALQAIQGGVEQPGADMVWNILEPMAKRGAAAAGLEFVPGPEEMEEMIRSSYRAPSTQVVRFGV